MKNFTYIFSVLSLLSIQSCMDKKSDSATCSFEQINKKKHKREHPNSRIKKIEDISGEYELVEGKFYFVNSPSYSYAIGALVIEKLSETDFGYYSATTQKEIGTTADDGIIRNLKNKFLKIETCDLGLEEYSRDTIPSGIFLHYQVMIEKNKDYLLIIHHYYDSREYMIYKKKKKQAAFSRYLIRHLENRRKNYKKNLLEYDKARNHDKNKLQIEYTIEDSTWKSVHTHHEINNYQTKTYNTSIYIHKYGYLNQNGVFAKQDSVYYNKIKNY